ncbi:MAG: sulfatase-like hydrolase/transferase [Planctomycetota bacterium]|jgi:arylsulfatase A-like enzyme
MIRFALLFALLFNALLSSTSAASKPNILFILADDVGREVLGCYGGESYRTPRLDELAATGRRFEHCYAMPVCHPTRITLLTGRYPRHLGSPRWGSFPKHAENQTFAHVMKSAGYATAIAGKWQICTLGKQVDHPQRLGFDESSLFGWHEGPRYHEPMIYQNGKVRTDTAGKYGPDLYVDFLIDFMQRHKDGPFFAYYSMALCHDVTDDLKEPVPYGEHGRYDNYTEMAENMDRCVGRLVDALDRMGVREETLILFTTDNGTAKRSIIRAEDGKYIRDPVVSIMNGKEIPGGKGDLTDWGTRVPTIANWPGVVQPASVENSLVDFSDVLPTFAELSGGRLPSGVPLDGHSFAGLLTGDGSTQRTWAYAESRGNRYFVKTQDWKLYDNGRLFHTERDPHEKQRLNESDVPAADLAVLKQAMASLKARK